MTFQLLDTYTATFDIAAPDQQASLTSILAAELPSLVRVLIASGATTIEITRAGAWDAANLQMAQTSKEGV